MVDPALGVLGYAMKWKSRMPIRSRKWSIKRTRWAWRKFSSPKRDAAPKIYSMEEWQRILASSATGFTLGVVSEPIRFWLTANLNQRRARLALHRCFAQISVDVKWMLDAIATYEIPEVMTAGELWNALLGVYTQALRRPGRPRRSWRLEKSPTFPPRRSEQHLVCHNWRGEASTTSNAHAPLSLRPLGKGSLNAVFTHGIQPNRQCPPLYVSRRHG